MPHMKFNITQNGQTNKKQEYRKQEYKKVG